VEHELREALDSLENLFACTSAPAIVWDPELRITRFNLAFEELTQRTADEVVGRHIELLFPEDERRTQALERVSSATAGESWQVVEIPILRADGEVRTVLWNSATVYADDGVTLVTTIAQGQDITERLHAEEALRESEEKYRGLFANAQVAMFRTRLDGSAVLAFNPRMCEIIGYTEEEILADSATIRWADPEARTVMFEKLLVAGSLRDYELDIVHSSGEVRTLLASLELHLEQDYLEGSATDITERKRAEKALLESARRQSALIESMQDGLGVVDIDGVLLDVNPALCAMTGFSREELVGTGAPHPFWPPEEFKAIDGVFRPALRGETKEAELTFMRKSSERFPVAVSPAVVRDSEGRVEMMFATMKDVTERKHAETEVRRLNAELEQRVFDRTAQLEAANKELEAFTYSVSHDLRAPLRHISGFSSLLSERVEGSLDEKSRHYVDTIATSVAKMGVLIDDLLQFSRSGRTEVQVTNVDMEQALSEVLEPLRLETADRDIEWSIGPLPRVVGDHGLLRQVWSNLVGNAVKFSRDKPTARIEIGVMDRDGESPNGAPIEDVFYVRDNGAGFDMQYADKLFGVFQRLHSSTEFEGTGIGLANVQRIVHRLGGRVWAEAELDNGATFYFALPRRKGSPS
jgi:PAS domain S-box-containing protein